MKRLTIITLILLWPTLAMAGNEVVINKRAHQDTTRGFGADANLDGDENFAAGIWTQWVIVGVDSAVCYEINFVRATSATAVTMRCESSNTNVADDAGFDVHSQDIAGGAVTSEIATYTYTTSVSAKWPWCVPTDNVPHRMMRCLFTSTDGGAADFVTISTYGVSP